MSGSYWKQVHAEGLAVPSDRPLDDLTAELTRMLGSPDPAQRDGTAYPTLATWIDRGVYDDLLSGLGDGMALGLQVGLGETGTDSVFRRSFSVLVLGECIARDNAPAADAGRQDPGVGRPGRHLAAARARPARLRARQRLGARGGARRGRARHARASPRTCRPTSSPSCWT